MVAVFPQKHLTDIAEWHRMGEAGIFPPEARLELIVRRNSDDDSDRI